MTAVRALVLALALILVAAAPTATAAKRCADGYRKLSGHCVRLGGTGVPPRGFSDTYRGTRGTLTLFNRRGTVTARLNWRVTLVCSDGAKLASSRGIEDEVRVDRARKFTMSVPSTIGTATFSGGWRNRNRVSGTLTISGYPASGGDATCAGTYASSFVFKSRSRLD